MSRKAEGIGSISGAISGMLAGAKDVKLKYWIRDLDKD